MRKAAANVLGIVGAVGLVIIEAEAERLVARFENDAGSGDAKKAILYAALVGFARKEGIPVTKRILNLMIERAVVALDPGVPINP